MADSKLEEIGSPPSRLDAELTRIVKNFCTNGGRVKRPEGRSNGIQEGMLKKIL